MGLSMLLARLGIQCCILVALQAAVLVKKLRAGLATQLQQQIEGQHGGWDGGGRASSSNVVTVIAGLLEDEEAAMQRDRS